MNSNESLQRTNNRAFNALRPIQYTTGIAPHALGSVLFSFGNTQVICACTIDNKYLIGCEHKALKVVG